MSKHYQMKESVTFRGLFIREFRSYSICGDDMVAVVRWAGDMYQVETQIDGYEPHFEYFSNLSAAIAYAETV